MLEIRSENPSNFSACPCCTDGRMLIKNTQIAVLNMDLTEDLFRCLNCDKRFRKLEACLAHDSCTSEVDCIPITYICQICGNDFNDNQSFLNHSCSRRASNAQKLNCSVCKKKTFLTLLNLNRHINTVHSSVLYRCIVCEKTYTKKYLLKIHYRVHTGEKPYPCKICGRKFSSSALLWCHKKFSHLATGYQCDTCSNFFPTRQMLANHIRIKHTKERSLSCEECGKTFLSTSVFYQHKALHSEVRKHKCQKCPMDFKRLSTLKRHEMIHNNIKPYLCSICGNQFRQNSDLKKHSKLLHSGLSVT